MTDLGRSKLNHVALQRSIILGCWEMVAGYRNRTDPVLHCLKGDMENVLVGQMVNVIPIDNAAAQQMMDDLWHGGLRPSTGVSSTGEAEALRGEIKHLRAIVTRIVNTEWPNDSA